MPRPRLQVVRPNHAAGLVLDNSGAPPDFTAYPQNSLYNAINCRITPEGSIRKLQGSRRVHATAIDGGVQINGGFSWRKGSGTVEQMVTTDNLFTGTYALGMSWTSRAGALDNTKRHDMVAFRDGSGEVVYIADGGLLNKWDGSTVTVNIASTPNALRLAVYNQRLFAITGSDENLYWSGLNNGDTLGIAASGGGVAVVRTFGGQQIKGLAVVGGSLLLFHANAISRFTGYAQTDISIDAGVVGQAQGVGTLAPRSIVVVDDGGTDVALFLTSRGLYAATEGSTGRIPTPFDSLLADTVGTAGWDNAYAVANTLAREVWFVLPALGTYIYNYERKAWTGNCYPDSVDSAGSPETGGTNVMWLGTDATNTPMVLGGGYDGFVRRFDYPGMALKDMLSDGSGGESYTMRLTFAPMFFGDETLDKLLRHFYVTGISSGGADVEVAMSWGTDKDVAASLPGGSATITIPAVYGTAVIPWSGVGRWVLVTLEDANPTPTMIGPVRGEAFALGRRR